MSRKALACLAVSVVLGAAGCSTDRDAPLVEPVLFGGPEGPKGAVTAPDLSSREAPLQTLDVAGWTCRDAPAAVAAADSLSEDPAVAGAELP